MSQDVVKSSGVSQPGFLSKPLMDAVAMLNAAGYNVVAKNRVAEIVLDAAVEEPPADVSDADRNAHFDAVWAHLCAALSQEIARRAPYAKSVTPIADRPGFVALKVAAIIVTPPGRSVPVAPRQKLQQEPPAA